jgi:hypothetical protein
VPRQFFQREQDASLVLIVCQVLLEMVLESIQSSLAPSARKVVRFISGVPYMAGRDSVLP